MNKVYSKIAMKIAIDVLQVTNRVLDTILRPDISVCWGMSKSRNKSNDRANANNY